MITATFYLNTVFVVEIENTSNNKPSLTCWVNIYRLPIKTNIKPVLPNLLSCKVRIAWQFTYEELVLVIVNIWNSYMTNATVK